MDWRPLEEHLQHWFQAATTSGNGPDRRTSSIAHC